MKLQFTLNGKEVEIDTDPTKRLLDLLRDDFNLSSVKEGCSEGECGSCTVIMDNKAVTSCLVLAAQVNGSEIITTEGLAADGELDIIQQAFSDNDAVQCGFCTPGMIMSAKALLLKNTSPAKEDIKEAIAGNLCRCTGYINIIKAIEDAARRLEDDNSEE
ncbi:MAG: (2Fe-2S)-binding protein [Halanaerobiales bacterium]